MSMAVRRNFRSASTRSSWRAVGSANTAVILTICLLC